MVTSDRSCVQYAWTTVRSNYRGKAIQLIGHICPAGTLRSCDPDRVVLKKIVLSGYPVKVHKKKAVVRWMFHNPEYVRWFKPLELWTKYGRRGRIKVQHASEPLAGYSTDIVCLEWLSTTLYIISTAVRCLCCRYPLLCR